MSKGKFSNPRPYREEEREIEKSFRQLTGQEKPPKPDDPIFSEASVPDLDTTDPEAAGLITEADSLFPEGNWTFHWTRRRTPRSAALRPSLIRLFPLWTTTRSP